MKNIIFLSGLAVPKIIAKSKLVWNDSLWKDYNRIYITSKVPISDYMVERELHKLMLFISRFKDVTVAGHSLGAWWAANLACMHDSKIKKLVMLTPLADVEPYPIFNVSPYYSPLYQEPVTNVGPQSSLVIGSHFDLIVPPGTHALKLAQHFKSSTIGLQGGHFYQKNHQEVLQYMKEWIEID